MVQRFRIVVDLAQLSQGDGLNQQGRVSVSGSCAILRCHVSQLPCSQPTDLIRRAVGEGTQLRGHCWKLVAIRDMPRLPTQRQLAFSIECVTVYAAQGSQLIEEARHFGLLKWLLRLPRMIEAEGGSRVGLLNITNPALGV